MNSQDLSNLQEAYLEVYQLDEGLIKYPWGYVTKQIERKKKSGDKSYKELQRRHERLRDLTSNELGKPEYRLQDSEKTQKEEYDLYDIILSHLLDEGYAETQEQAEVIMVNMSEDWRESIMEEILDEKTATPPSRWNARRGLDAETRRRRRSSDFAIYGGENQDPDERKISTSKGEGGVTKNPKKLRKQKAMGEH